MDEQFSTKDPALALPSPSAQHTLEPVYTLEVACELIPMPSKQSLEQFLHYHKDLFVPLYRPMRWYRVRMLSESDCIKIREMTLFSGKRNGMGYNPFLERIRETGAPVAASGKSSYKSGLAKRPKTVAPAGSPLARILRMANA